MLSSLLNNAVDISYPDYKTRKTQFYSSTKDKQTPARHDELFSLGSGRPSGESKFQLDSVERRFAEIIRLTTRSFPEMNIKNVLEANQQATWKQEKVQDSPKNINPLARIHYAKKVNLNSNHYTN